MCPNTGVHQDVSYSIAYTCTGMSKLPTFFRSHSLHCQEYCFVLRGILSWERQFKLPDVWNDCYANKLKGPSLTLPRGVTGKRGGIGGHKYHSEPSGAVPSSLYESTGSKFTHFPSSPSTSKRADCTPSCTAPTTLLFLLL